MKRLSVWSMMLVASIVLSLLAAPVSAAATPIRAEAIKAIEEDCLVIIVDGQNLGEQVMKEKWQYVVDTYAAGGENLNVANGDWYYYTSSPFDLGHPLVTGQPLPTAKWLQDFLKQVGRSDFPWERVFFYDSGSQGTYIFEPWAFGYGDNYQLSSPDGVFVITTESLGQVYNPFGKNVILLGFPDCSGLHGEIHLHENILENKLAGAVWVSAEGKVAYFDWGNGQIMYVDKEFVDMLRQTGRCHVVLKSYLDKVGIAADSTLPGSDTNVFDGYLPLVFNGYQGYGYGVLSDGITTEENRLRNNVYHAYLMKTWRDQYWQILEYYRRFFEYSPTATVQAFPTVPTTTVVITKPAAKPSAWAAAGVTRAQTLNLAIDCLTGDYQSTTTRAEFCRGAVNFLQQYGYNLDLVTPKFFSDTSDRDIGIAAALGITNGTDKVRNLFSPDSLLTREQAAAMLKNTLQVLGLQCTGDDVGWADANDISTWAKEAVNVVYHAGIMGGVSPATLVFSPQTSYTHEQSIITLARMWDYTQPA